MNVGCLLFLKIVEKNKMRANDGEYPRGYRCKNNKYRENPGDRISERVSKGRGIKMHLHSAAESRLSTSAKWKRSLQQLSRNSTDRYPFPSGELRPIV